MAEPLSATLLILLLDVLKAFLITFGTFAAYWIAKKCKMDSIGPVLEQNIKSSIENAINNAKIDVENPNSITKNINVKTDIVDKSLKNIKTISPKFIKTMKLTDAELENRILSIISSSNGLEKIKHLIKE